MVQHTLTYETSTIVDSPGSQTHITTMYQTIFVFLGRWTRASTVEIHRPGSACSAISYVGVGPKTMEFLQHPKSGSGGAANEEWLHIGKCPPKIQTFWILDWEIWPVWISFFSIDFLTPPTWTRDQVPGRQLVSKKGSKHLPEPILIHFEGAGNKQPWNDS